MLKNVKAKFITTKMKLEKFATPITAGIATTMCAINSRYAYAALDIGPIVETIIGAIGVLLIAPAIMMAIMGFAGYASAHSEGDGPAQQKAVGKLTAAAMLLMVGVLLEATKTTFAEQIVNAAGDFSG